MRNLLTLPTLVALLSCAGMVSGMAKENYFSGYTPKEFAALKEAQKEIKPGKFNEELLSAAIFHETNVRRVEKELPDLAFHEEVRDAALKHAKYMAKQNDMSHREPKSDDNTRPYERLKAEGLRAKFSAENVAMSFVPRYESGKPFFTRQEDGETIRSYKPGGPGLPAHTYLSFAVSILDQWMDSPPHRKNIVSKYPQYLGVGCGLSKDANGMDMVFAGQSFFTPMR